MKTTTICSLCGNILVDYDGEQLRSFVKYEKYVPHHYVYKAFCLDCEKNKIEDLKNNGFVQYDTVLMDE